MKNVFRSTTLLQMAGLFFLFAACISWQPDGKKTLHAENAPAAEQDTISPKSAHPDQTELQLNIDSAMQQVNEALSKIDYAKMNADVQKAMASIDYNKINRDINSAMKSIDWSKMKTDVSTALDSAKIAINSINWDEIKANADHAQQEAKKAIAAQKTNTQEIQNQVQKAMKDAQQSLHQAQAELVNYKGLTSALEKDGLIAPNKPFRITLKAGDLYINDVKQSKTTTDKYNRFYQNRKDFSINSDGKDEADL